jgi:hypothetical protein
MKMTFTEREYFEALVLGEQAEVPEIRVYYRKRMRALVENSKLETVRVSGRGLLSDTVVPALLIYLIDIERVVPRQLKLDDFGSCRQLKTA